MLALCRVVLWLACVGVVKAFSAAIRKPKPQAKQCRMAWRATETESRFIIAPSILSANFAKLGEEVDQVLDAGADVIHFDVMDSHYVPTLTLGPMVCRALREHGVARDIDVHLMTTNVDPLIRDFAHAGASYITFHPETTHHVDRSLQLIRSLGCRSGLVLNPSSSLELCRYVLDKVDLLVIMAVNPGFPGQQFLPSSYAKLREARRMVQASGCDVRIEVDGGVSARNIRQLAEAGADTFVAGSAIFGAPSAVSAPSTGESKGSIYRRVIDELRSELRLAAVDGRGPPP